VGNLVQDVARRLRRAPGDIRLANAAMHVLDAAQTVHEAGLDATALAVDGARLHILLPGDASVPWPRVVADEASGIVDADEASSSVAHDQSADEVSGIVAHDADEVSSSSSSSVAQDANVAEASSSVEQDADADDASSAVEQDADADDASSAVEQDADAEEASSSVAQDADAIPLANLSFGYLSSLVSSEDEAPRPPRKRARDEEEEAAAEPRPKRPCWSAAYESSWVSFASSASDASSSSSSSSDSRPSDLDASSDASGPMDGGDADVPMD
jgi:hypothetical protein